MKQNLGNIVCGIFVDLQKAFDTVESLNVTMCVVFAN